MAGDWIKMRTDLDEDPSVIGVAEDLGIDEDLVIGKLWKLWRWADRQTTDGNAPSVTEKWVDRYIGVTGFAAALQKHGWLIISDSGICIPNFDRHNGKSAKSRALTLKRVRNARSVTEALPEKRREEKRREEKIPTGDEALSKSEVLNEAIPLKQFEDTPEALADEFKIRFDGPTSAAERDVRQITPMMRAIIGFGVRPSAIREEIYRKDRDRNEKLWQFKKRFEDRHHGRRPKQNMRETEYHPLE